MCNSSWLVTSNASFIDPQLLNADYVFVRKHALRSLLERTYYGPFKVFYKADKYFTLLQNGVLNNVSINRLKTAHLLLFHADDSLRSSTSEATKSTENVRLSSDDSSSSQSPQLPDSVPVFRRSRVGRVIRPPAILDL